MRDFDVLYDGDLFYSFDRESKIVSFQKKEEVRLPTALPNPFFLPIHFLGIDDDSCQQCKMRLKDVRDSTNWETRSGSFSLLRTDSNNGSIHSVVKLDAGSLHGIAYDYRLRLVGAPDSLQLTSIARTKADGTPVAEVLLRDFRDVRNFNPKVAHQLEIGARDDAGRLALHADYRINKLRINEGTAKAAFAPSFPGAEKYWNSDARSFERK
jgi:hypothetical protein